MEGVVNDYQLIVDKNNNKMGMPSLANHEDELVDSYVVPHLVRP